MYVWIRQTIPVAHAVTKENAAERLGAVTLKRPPNPPTTFRFILDPSPDQAWRDTFERIATGMGFSLTDGEVSRPGRASDLKCYAQTLDTIISDVNRESAP